MYTLRMQYSDNRTTRADELVQLNNPDGKLLRDKIRSLLSRGKVSMIVTASDGTDVFYSHDRVCLYFLSL